MLKNTEISERISKIIDYLGVNPNNFSKKLDYDRSQTIYDIINGKSAPSFDFFKRFMMSEYSEVISIDWLLTGRGSMEVQKNETAPILLPDVVLDYSNCPICKEKEKRIEDLKETIAILRAQVNAPVAEDSTKRITA